MKEKLPDFLDYEELFNVPTYRQVKKPCHLSPDSYSDLFDKPFKDVKIESKKLTHITRGNCIRQLDAELIPPDRISRVTGHATPANGSKASQVQKQSYLFNKLVDCLVALCRGDPNHPDEHQPPYSIPDVDESILHQVPELVLLLDEHDKIHHHYHDCSCWEECKKLRLYTAKGSIDEVIHEIKCAFQVLAAHPIDPETLLLMVDSPIIFDLYRYGTLKQILDLPVFLSPEFESLKARVRESENLLHGFDVEVSQPVRNELHRSLLEFRKESAKDRKVSKFLLIKYTEAEERRAREHLYYNYPEHGP
jgi:hypothetical protein